MPENTIPDAADNAAEEIEKEFSLSDILALIQPEPVRNMIAEKLNEHVALVRENNSRVAKVNEAKQTDPNNTEYIDSVWKRVVAEDADPDIVKLEKRYQKLIDDAEKALAEMRAIAKAKHITPPLSDEQVQNLRKSVNDGKDVIAKSAIAAETMAQMADQMLTIAGNAIEGGIFAKLPQADSLLNARGRKASAGNSGGGTYASRLVSASIDGVSTDREQRDKDGNVVKVKASFIYVAEELSKRFNDKAFPSNQVTAIEVEEAYFKSKGVEFRKLADMPDTHEFEFSKTIQVQNPNDDSTHNEPHTVKLSVTKWTKETAGLTDNAETEKSDNK